MYIIPKKNFIKKYNNNIILGNRDNGLWVKISKEKLSEITKELSDCDDKKIIEKYSDLIFAKIIVKDEVKINQNRIDSVMLAITNHCNLHCIHCGFEAGPDDKTEIPTHLVKKLIIKNNDIKEIVITGGEPLTHKGFFDITKCLRENFTGKSILMTNGTLINRDSAYDIKNTFDSVAISIDGASESSCDKMRGHGVFQKVIDSVKILQESGMSDISLSMTVTDYNDKEEYDFIDLCKQINVEPILRDLFLVGRAKKNYEQLEGKRNNIVSNIVFDNLDEECKKIKLNGKCMAGKNSLFVQYNQNIYPCPVAAVNPDFIMGRVDDENYDLTKITKNKCVYSGLNNFLKISPDKISECKNCCVNDFCWGCIQEYYTYIQNPTIFKKFCSYQMTNLKKVIWRE